MTSAAMPSEFHVESATLREQAALVVRGTVGQAHIGSFLGDALARVSEVARADGMNLSGPPFARVHPESDGRLSLEAGFPVSGMLLGQGDVKASHLPAGVVLRTTHRGDYGQAWKAHDALHAFAAGHGLRPAGDAWEVYLDSPDVVSPRTLVVLPVRPVSEAPSTRSAVVSDAHD